MAKLWLSLLLICQSWPSLAQENLYPAALGLEVCFAPVEPYTFKLDKSDPLYDTARDDHQRHLEELEDYINCLDRERSQALDGLRSSFDLFVENFGRDAVMKYAAEKQAGEQSTTIAHCSQHIALPLFAVRNCCTLMPNAQRNLGSLH